MESLITFGEENRGNWGRKKKTEAAGEKTTIEILEAD